MADALHAHLFPKVLSLCGRLLGDPVRAREMADDVWTDFALVHANKVQHALATEAYLRVLTVRRCRRAKAFQDRQAPLQEWADERQTPEAELIEADEARHRARHLDSCMERLDAQARRLLRMRFHLGMTQEAIGDQLGVSKQYAGRVIARTLEGLRICVGAAA